MLKVFVGLFAHFFFELTNNVNKVDIVAKSALAVKELSSAEGLYVDNMLKMFKMRQNIKHCNLVMFEKNMATWRGEDV